MDNSFSSDENFDLGYQPSPSSIDQNDQSAAETPVYSTMSGDSLVYCRTYSQTSGFSDPTDDHTCYCSEPSPSHWPVNKSGGASNHPVLTRLGMKQHKNDKLDDQESAEAGDFFFIFICR